MRNLCSISQNISIAIVVLILSGSHLLAQIETNIKLLTPQEQQYLNTAKSVYKEYRKLRKQYLKDSTKISKRIYKQGGDVSENEIRLRVRNSSDSLYQAYGLERYESLVMSHEQYVEDPEGWRKYLEENEDFVKEQLEQFDEDGKMIESVESLSEYAPELGKIKLVSENPDSLLSGNRMDQIAEKQFMDLDEVQELQKQSSNLPDVNQLTGSGSLPFEVPPDGTGNIQQQALRQAKTLGGQFINQNNGVLDDAQKKFGKLKKKYSTVLSSNNLSSATKTNSLEGESFGKRLILGGNLQLTRDIHQTNLDIAPLLGYKFNKKLSLGISGVYRAAFGQQDEFFDYLMEENIYGGRVYMEFQLMKGFFGHGEYEQMNSMLFDPVTESPYRKWVDGILIGLGKKYRMSRKMKGNVMVLYNTMHQEGASPYKSPWQLRFGFGKL